ncbi:T-lymphoma invasion and metastasis-inducing protein 2-like [Salarias fasciatus]|uniref:T-lymphoma invasion and metastasis-inducing protein 2-like n=1 Tax=Salarias fasciatus TaxID=181472 RepID=UPI001177073C|nr:T-lymphoma invasion and metastasis-inducing protein 2-like [Salarias fasciatus]
MLPAAGASRRRPLTPCPLAGGASARRRPLTPCPLAAGALCWNVDGGSSLYQTFPECRVPNIEVPQNPYAREAGLQTRSSWEAGLQPASPSHLSVCQRLRKVIEELVDTERSYVKDLLRLLRLYMSPLQQQEFLTEEEMEALFGLLPQMLDFQQVFLWTLEQTVASCPGFSSWSRPEQFQTLLVSLGSSFLRHAEGFKLYGGFCSSHSRVQKVLERARTDGAFKRFLDGRNPTNQHSSSLESYLIKPVQRVLKYPLLLRELLVLTEPASPQHTHLAEALASMLRVVSHINETQQIYEEYGALFHQLTAEPGGRGQQVGDVSMVDFLLQSSAVWLNPLPGLRKDPELTLLVFRRAVVLVYRDNQDLILDVPQTGSPSADPDPFRFRWFIPGSALRVRPASIAGSGDPCVWELIHSRSEAEGRPETVFQLCSSGLETKASVLRALRSLLRERAHHPSLRTIARPSGFFGAALLHFGDPGAHGAPGTCRIFRLVFCWPPPLDASAPSSPPLPPLSVHAPGRIPLHIRGFLQPSHPLIYSRCNRTEIIACVHVDT